MITRGQVFLYTSRAPWGPGKHFHVYECVAVVTKVTEDRAEFEVVRVISEKDRPPFDWARPAPKGGGFAVVYAGTERFSMRRPSLSDVIGARKLAKEVV